MDIHKPKAAHNWREFLTEIGTIVCGILIALGLEQVVEARHWAEVVHEAKHSIHDELALASVFGEERRARLSCADDYLKVLAQAVVESPAQWKPRPVDYCGVPHDTIYAGRWRPWPTEVWHGIEAAGVVPHFDAHYRAQAPFTFGFVGEIGVLSEEESRRATELEPLAYPLILSPETKAGLLKSIAALRLMNQRAAAYSLNLDGQIAELGEAPSKAELQQRRNEVPYLFAGPGKLLNTSDAPTPRH
ncbi:MAG: hypothetical protein M3N05_00935 [Pseudomonadota bacterium]|nr:hypothetical protein [Pseudomonadota bacterium]